MVEIFNALMRSLNNLQDRRIWLRLAGPALASLLVWLLLAFFALEWFVAQLLDFPPLTWIAGWGAVAGQGAGLGRRLAGRVCAGLHDGDAAGGDLHRALAGQQDRRERVSGCRTGRRGQPRRRHGQQPRRGRRLPHRLDWHPPLWLIPGMGLVLPIYWLAWLNRRTFAYDALAAHATKDEWKALFDKHRGKLLLLGVLLGLLAHVPIIGLLAPAFGALAYVHYGLEALRRERKGRTRSSKGGKAAMNFGAIIIGDEILSGKRQDRHFAKIAELLGHAACVCRGSNIWATTVPADRNLPADTGLR